MSAVSTESTHPLRGALLFVLGLLLFACLDATVKYLSQRYPVPLIAWARFTVHFALMVVIVGPIMKADLWRTQRTGLSIFRGLCLAVLSFGMMSALPRLPLAEATSIFFVAPMLVVIMARPILQERIGLLRGLALAGGFSGVLLIARPGSDLDYVGVAYVLGAALAYATYSLLSRILLRTERAATLLFYAACAGTICFSLVLPWVGLIPELAPLDWLLFFSMGISGGVGHYLYTRAFNDAPASVLAPLTYLQLLWAGLLGWLVFDQLPDALALLGMLIIAVCGAAVLWQGRDAKPVPPK